MRSQILTRIVHGLVMIALACGVIWLSLPFTSDARAESPFIPPLDVPRKSPGLLVDGNRIIVAGGSEPGSGTPLANASAYDFSTGRWNSLPNIGQAMFTTSLVSIGGQVYGAGLAPVYPSTLFFRYDVSTGATNRLAAYPQASNNGWLASAGGRIYLAGGYGDARAWVYDVPTNAWTEIAPMLGPRQTAALVGGPDGKLYIFSGSTGIANLVSAERYDPATNSWTPIGDVPAWIGWYGAATLGRDGLIYLVSQFTTYSYNPVTDEYVWLPAPPRPRENFSVATGPNGMIYQIGGAAGQPIAPIDVYDPVTRQWIGDSAAPAIGPVTINGGQSATRTANVQLQIVASDGTGSGVHEMSLANDNSSWTDWQPFTSSLPWQIRAVDGHRAVSVRVRDRAGNVSSVQSATIIMDRIAPRGSVALAGGPASGDRRSIDAPTSGLVLDATDDRSGVSEMRLSNRSDFAGAIWQPYRAAAIWDFNGGQTVYSQFRDRAGNTSATASAALSANPGPESPGPVVVCAPRPRVIVNVTRQDTGLDVTVSATGSQNALRAVRFDQFAHALVDAGDQRGMNQPFAVSIPASQLPVSLSFTVRRTAAGQGATVRLVVVDGCGEWTTLVGGGVSAFP